eukprot:g38661.t1
MGIAHLLSGFIKGFGFKRPQTSFPMAVTSPATQSKKKQKQKLLGKLSRSGSACGKKAEQTLLQTWQLILALLEHRCVQTGDLVPEKSPNEICAVKRI